MQISPYSSADALEIVKMWRESFEYGVGIKDENPIEDQLQYFLQKVVPENTVRVVKIQEQIVAFMASKPESISHLYVRLENLGNGIGGNLMALAKKESSGSLWLYTFARNSNARRFYERHGFREIERESQNMYKIEAIKYIWHRVRGEA